MIAGVPGIGIGGLYYILLAFLMPVREAGRFCIGRSEAKRWPGIARQTANALGILGASWLTGWLLVRAFQKYGSVTGFAGSAKVEQACTAFSLRMACCGLTILAAVVLLVYVLRFVVPRPQPQITGDRASDGKARHG